MSEEKEKKILDQVRDIMRVKHYSIHTERTYCDWIKRYITFHGMSARSDLNNGERPLHNSSIFPHIPDMNIVPDFCPLLLLPGDISLQIEQLYLYVWFY